MVGLSAQDLLLFLLIAVLVLLVFAGWLSRKQLIRSGIVVGFAVIALVVYARFSPKPPSPPPSQPAPTPAPTIAAPPQAPPDEDTLLTRLELTKLNWYKGGFDTIMMLDATLRNSGKRDVKDIEITCDYFSNSGTRLGAARKVVYEIVRANGTKTIQKFNMGFIHTQASRAGCRITSAVPMK